MSSFSFSDRLRRAKKVEKISWIALVAAIGVMLLTVTLQLVWRLEKVTDLWLTGVEVIVGAFIVLPTLVVFLRTSEFLMSYRRFREGAELVIGLDVEEVILDRNDDWCKVIVSDILYSLTKGVKDLERDFPDDPYHPERIAAKEVFERTFWAAKYLGLIDQTETYHRFFG